MSEEQNKLSDFNDLIHEKMGELIDLRSNTWKWLATEHTIKDTEARLNEARTISEELSQIAHGLVDHKKAVPADAKEVDSSFKIFDLVRGYERESEQPYWPPFRIRREKSKKTDHCFYLFEPMRRSRVLY
jgi:hypothetical protein